MSRLLALVALAAIILIGCESENKGRIVPPPVTQNPPSDQTDPDSTNQIGDDDPIPTDKTVVMTGQDEKFTVSPTTNTHVVMDDSTLVVMKTAYAKAVEVTISKCQPAPDFPKAIDQKPIGLNAQIEISASIAPCDDLVIELPQEMAFSRATRRASATVPFTSTRITGDVIEFPAFIFKGADGQWDIGSKIPTTLAEISAKVIIDHTKFIYDGIKAKITGVITKISFISHIEYDPALVSVLTCPNGVRGKRAVLIHGFNDNASVFDSLVRKFAADQNYSEVLVFQYDSREYIAVSAQNLASAHGKIYSSSTQIDYWMHSMGALVARRSMSHLGRTQKLINVFSICGANEGSAWARIEDVLQFLRKDFLNKPPNKRQPFGFPAFDTRSAADLKSNSDLVYETNVTDHLGSRQKTHANLFLIAGSSDMVVGTGSALADNVDRRTLTFGKICRKKITGHGHTSLLNSDDGVSDLIHALSFPNPYSVRQKITPISPYARREDHDWPFISTLENLTDHEIRVADFAVETFDLNGDWEQNGWYDDRNIDEGEAYSSHVDWNRTIPPYGKITLRIRLKATSDDLMIGQAPPEKRAKTVRFIARYEDDDGNLFSNNVSTFALSDGTPVPKTGNSR